MGLFDRLRGRGRYAAGTTPESVDYSPPPAPEWTGTAPPEWTGPAPPEPDPVTPEVEARPPRAGASGHYVTTDDLAAAYGWRNLSMQEDPPVDDVVTHTSAAGGPGMQLEVFVCDHRAFPGMAADDEANWRAAGPVQDLVGLGDSAFVTGDGTVFARLGDAWTVQVATGEWKPPVEQTAELVRRILARLSMAAPVASTAFPGIDEATEQRERTPPPATGPTPPRFPPPGGPGRPRGSRGGRIVFAAFVLLASAGLSLARMGDSEDSGGTVRFDAPYDLLGQIASEPGRHLNSQNVAFTMTDHQPMGAGLCPALSGCWQGTRGDFDVDGRPLKVRTWLLAFSGTPAANQGAERLEADPGLLDPDRPATSFTIVFNPGRWVQMVRLTHVEGAAVVPSDEDTKAVLRGIGAVSAESAIVDDARELDR